MPFAETVELSAAFIEEQKRMVSHGSRVEGGCDSHRERRRPVLGRGAVGGLHRGAEEEGGVAPLISETSGVRVLS